MARIMCTQRLWRRLGHTGRPPLNVQEPLIHGMVLGAWGAKVFRYDRRDLVIALNQRTYLTVVFPLAPRDRFRDSFATAVAHLLTDLQLPEEHVQTESAAIAVEPFARLTDLSLAGSLNALVGECEFELSRHDDLREVQLSVNEMPHVNRDPSFPIQAVAKLFENRNLPCRSTN